MGAQTGQQLENSPHYYFDPYLTFGVNVLTDLASARTLDALGIEPEHGKDDAGVRPRAAAQHLHSHRAE